MKKQIMRITDETILTPMQKHRLESHRKNGNVCTKLGYSSGCAASRGNFHSSWATPEGIFRIDGDSRNAWRGMIRKYGHANVH
jgi:hypothetical protein